MLTKLDAYAVFIKNWQTNTTCEARTKVKNQGARWQKQKQISQMQKSDQEQNVNWRLGIVWHGYTECLLSNESLVEGRTVYKGCVCDWKQVCDQKSGDYERDNEHCAWVLYYMMTMFVGCCVFLEVGSKAEFSADMPLLNLYWVDTVLHLC